MTGFDSISALVEPPPAAEESGTWLVILTDLVCLLLTFFVLLFSMSEVDQSRWKGVTSILAAGAPQQAASPVVPTESAAGGAEAVGVNLGYLGRLLETQIERSGILQTSDIHLAGERLVLSLPGDALFEGGGAGLAASGLPTLGELGNLLSNIANDVVVIGRAGDTRAADAAEAWNLSLARAAAVAEALRRAGYPRPIAAFGAGGAQADPLVRDRAQGPPRELVRRIDIIVTPTKGW